MTGGSHPLKQWQAALLLAALATAAMILIGLAVFGAGSLLLNVDLGLGRWVTLALPDDLVARGPVGVAAWLGLLGICSAPLLGLIVFALAYFGRKYAD